MPFYGLTSIYNLPQNGWTETVYRETASAKEAANVDAEYLRAALAFRPQDVTFEATRSHEEFGLRRIFLDLVALNGLAAGTRDAATTKALCRVDYRGGGYRHFQVRGLPDRFVIRKSDGTPNPPKNFLDMLQVWFQNMQRLSFRGRLKNADLPWFKVREYRRDPDGDYVQILTDGDFCPEPGSFVYFGEKGQWLLKGGRHFWVERSEPGAVTLWHPWPIPMGTFPSQGQRVRSLEFAYPEFETFEFVGYGTYKKGGVYRPMSFEPRRPRNVPVSTCQRIVDFGRKAYTVGMRFRQDDVGAIEPVRWFFLTHHLDRKFSPPAIVAEPPRTVIPYAHPFGQRNWDYNQWPELPLGEVEERQNTNGRQTDILTGEGLVGNASHWMTGAISSVTTGKFSPRTGWP